MGDTLSYYWIRNLFRRSLDELGAIARNAKIAQKSPRFNKVADRRLSILAVFGNFGAFGN